MVYLKAVEEEQSNVYLAHHGIKGQRWGIRRFQNEDGTLTTAGKKRYSDGEPANHKDPVDYSKDLDITTTGDSKNSTTVIKSSGTVEGRRKTDDFFNIDESYGYYDGDWNACSKFDSIGSQYITDLNNKGEDYAIQHLSSEMKGLAYTLKVEKEWLDEWNEYYCSFSLDVKGEKYAYRTQGEEDYTDEQYFYKLKGN